ncbi:uncharacterized protein LOC112344181 [Selaginella moellendorffii]|uniref:uncharacterized protein LOC112344181 n=1 Tax=Selaginella moellendorffii TaxID=88036 RepID=UPI000D1C8467|nr:uncharacterized protein LOC112344181 [Selaginella moellendorffii]|eukprot:XP_024524248.1 uncharacterized protein LOC112344181 [Selaginella moellendorffii]
MDDRTLSRLLGFVTIAIAASAVNSGRAGAAGTNEDLVDSLPGQPAVNFKHYAGQIVVNERNGRALFYWFFEADHPNASSLPVALWLNGGPGCSSVGNGGLSELGPFTTNDNATGVVLNSYSWTKEANIIFLESPIGVGFSYSETKSDFEEFYDKRIAKDSLAFLKLWYEKFPEYKANEFYMIGESYAGHYIPTLAWQVLLHNRKVSAEERINLKGFAIGNPWTDAYYDNRGTTEFFHSHSLISDETYAGLLNCDFANDLPIDARSNNSKCRQALTQADIDMEKINMYDVLAESCNPLPGSSSARKSRQKAFYLAAGYDPCLDSVTPYLNLPSVQDALHVKKTRKWSGCNDVIYSNYNRADIVRSMLPLYRKLLQTHLRIWIYSGDVDGVVATIATKSWISQLNLTVQIPWYAWDFNNQVGGWTQVYKGMTFTTVRGAGHMVPATKPQQALQVFKSFLAGEALPSFPIVATGDVYISHFLRVSTPMDAAFALFILLTSFLTALAPDPSHLVSNLPGQPQVNFNQYAGQVTVNPTTGKALFYWFYEADHQNSSLQLPLAIWMNGGPGCSSVGSGALGELGPFRTNDAGSGLVLNPYAWNQVVNLIFLEAPHGVGFSYSNTTSDYNQYSDDIMASDVLVFILEWFKRFPEYSKNDFYLLGESYAGHYVPTLAAKILDYNKKKAGAFINFKGFALGNPWSDTYSDNKGDTDFFHSHSLISDEIYNQVVANCDFAKDLPIDNGDANPLCRFAVSAMFNSIQYVDTYNVYAPACNQQDPNGTILSQTLRENTFMHTEMLAAAYDPCADTVSPYLNSKDVQTALHVEFMPGKWSFCSRAANGNYPRKEITNSMLPLYRSLLKEGLKIWIYSGDVDGVVSTIGTRAWIKKLNLTITQKWYPWKFQDQVGGWSEKYAGLTLATVRGAGHMVPFDKPEQALLLFQHFVDGSSLPGF